MSIYYCIVCTVIQRHTHTHTERERERERERAVHQSYPSSNNLLPSDEALLTAPSNPGLSPVPDLLSKKKGEKKKSVKKTHKTKEQ